MQWCCCHNETITTTPVNPRDPQKPGLMWWPGAMQALPSSAFSCYETSVSIWHCCGFVLQCCAGCEAMPAYTSAAEKRVELHCHNH